MNDSAKHGLSQEIKNSRLSTNASSVVAQLIKPNYWSGHPQTAYFYLDQKQRKQGPAKTPVHPGQFNLYTHLARLPEPSRCTQATFLQALPCWSRAALLASTEVDGCPLADTALVLGPVQMGQWLLKLGQTKLAANFFA